MAAPVTSVREFRKAANARKVRAKTCSGTLTSLGHINFNTAAASGPQPWGYS
jgi:hypothetical protein